MNRKGSLTDILSLMLFMAVVVIVAFLSLYIQTQANAGIIAAAPAYTQSSNSTYIMNQGVSSLGLIVGSIPFIIIGLGLASIISAFFIPSHPAFVPISIILLGFYTILATIFANIMWEFLNIAEILPLANGYPLLVSMVVNLPYIVTIFGGLLIIFMHSKIQ